MDIKIIVATHKKYWMPEDKVYLPLHVGSEGKMNLGYTCDNTGYNISIKNPYFCELTGLYWAWKNLSCDYIGMCHYRRYFMRSEWVWAHNVEELRQQLLSYKDYAKYLQKYDVILPEPVHLGETVAEHYARYHNLKDLEHLATIVKCMCPDYADAWQTTMTAEQMFIANMFAMSKKYFDAYCQWLFAILFKFEQEMDITGYDMYQARIYGFLGERLLNVWMTKQNLKTLKLPMVGLENNIDWKWKHRFSAYMKYKLQEFIL